MTKKTDVERAYLAGFLDGEGHIGFDTFGGKRSPTICVTITNTSIDILSQVATEWNGNLYVRKPSAGRPAHWKPSADAKWSSQKAHVLLKELLPFLRIKRKQAELAIEFFKTVNPPEHRSKKISLSNSAKRDEIYRNIRSLNKRPQRTDDQNELRVLDASRDTIMDIVEP